jgi:hypothetical protein
MGITGSTGPTGPTGNNVHYLYPPTSDPGVTGQVWFDTAAGVIKVSGLT